MKAMHPLIHHQLASILTSSVEVERRQYGVHSHGHGSHPRHGGLQGLLISLWEDVEARAVARFSLDGVPALPFLQNGQVVLELKDWAWTSTRIVSGKWRPGVRKDRSSPSPRLRCGWCSCRIWRCTLLCSRSSHHWCYSPAGSVGSGGPGSQFSSSSDPPELPKSWRPSRSHSSPWKNSPFIIIIVSFVSWCWFKTTHLVLDRTDQAVLPPVHILRYLRVELVFKSSISDRDPLLHLQIVHLLIDFLGCLEGQ